jgi:hypothetical protein
VLLWLERARGASSEHEAPQRPKSIRMDASFFTLSKRK